jgi:hypothetical protein
LYNGDGNEIFVNKNLKTDVAREVEYHGRPLNQADYTPWLF